jgi:TldD protein
VQFLNTTNLARQQQSLCRHVLPAICTFALSATVFLPVSQAATAAVEPGSQITAGSSPQTSNKTLSIMAAELQRAFDVLKRQTTPVHFLAYRLYTSDTATVRATNGLVLDLRPHELIGGIQIEVRVGSPQLDSTHPLKTAVRRMSSASERFVGMNCVPLEGDADGLVLKQNLWLETEKAYRKAVDQFGHVLAEQGLSTEEDQCRDFSSEGPADNRKVADSPLAPVDVEALTAQARDLSRLYTKYPEIEESWIEEKAANTKRYLVNSEGTALSYSRTNVSVTTSAGTTSQTGEHVHRTEARAFRSQKEVLDGKAELSKLVEDLGSSVNALRKAPVAEPFCGPAILSGSAAAVLFHEVLGHRLEASRHRDLADGKTFSAMLNRQIMPPFISVYDRPLADKLHGISLVGHYDFDDEGVKAEDVTLVKNGMLVGFLMSRRPVPAFAHSNGHGRCDGQPDNYPTARMANLVVESSKVTSAGDLRNQLLAEARKQSKPYGLLIERVEAGITYTSSYMGQLFQVHPSLVKRIYVDGRPDELVRGVRIVGTPMAALQHIIQCSDRTEVFNGACGAESGFVPQSNSSPAILIDYLETERQLPNKGIAVILPPPAPEPGKAGNR